MLIRAGETPCQESNIIQSLKKRKKRINIEMLKLLFMCMCVFSPAITKVHPWILPTRGNRQMLKD